MPAHTLCVSRLFYPNLIIHFLTIKNFKIMSAFTDQVKGNWNVIKGKLKQEYAELTEDDLTYTEGKEEEMLGRIQKRTGKAKEEVKDFIDSCC
jgi:uncharacterized protein YjbJ (UPF0337 family)